MTQRILTGLTAALAAFSLNACIAGGATETEGENGGGGLIMGLTVNVVDSTGAAFAADTVYWSYQADGHAAHKSAHGTDTTLKAAKRLNVSGTKWEITYAGLHGAVYVRGAYHRPDSANPSLCSWTAYTHLQASAATLPATVTLVLKPKKVCL